MPPKIKSDRFKNEKEISLKDLTKLLKISFIIFNL